jgi:hypothetical protein
MIGVKSSFAATCVDFDQWIPRADAAVDSVWISEGNNPRYFTYDADDGDPFLFVSNAVVAPGTYKFTAELEVKDSPSPVSLTLENALTREGATIQASVSSGLKTTLEAEVVQQEGSERVVLSVRGDTTFRARISAAVGNARLCPVS